VRTSITAVALSIGCLALTAGCGDADDVERAESNISQTLTLRFELKDGALTLKSSGRNLTCGERFEGLEGERISCERSGEKVQVIVKSDGASVVAVRDLDKKRGYYECVPSGEVEGAPALMKCKLTTIKPRGSGGLSSPFDSSVPGISVPNSHWVDADETILRGMEPRTPAELDELRAEQIEKVLIFKNATSGHGIEDEIASWALPEGDVLHVPFKWKDLGGFEEPCAQTVEALRFIRESEAAEKKVFFHCTVGEDRTGYLAALYALLFEEADARDAFGADMCEHGYGRGNPQKPAYVIGKLEDGLTPLYRSMAYLVDQGVLTAELEAEACGAEPEVPEDFMSEPLACGVSTTLVP
jgi:protein-tyrosine phosphatase